MSDFNQERRKELLKLARTAIEEYILRGNKIKPPGNEELNVMRGVFVTLKINGELRGCIGYIIPIRPLGTTIIDCAIAAATEDPRFSALKPKELNKIKIEISALSPLKRVKNNEEILVGTHGIIISKGLIRGLLLPQVATEYKWDRQTFLEQTCYKAGLPKDAWKEKDTIIEIFSAEVFSEEELETQE